MKGYKGFDKNLKCRDKQYAIGEVFEEKDASLCKSGMHFCENPHDCFVYYNPAESRYCEIDADEVSDESEDDSKRACKKMRTGTEISAFDIAKMSVSVFFENFKFDEKILESNCADDFGIARDNFRGAAKAGKYGIAKVLNCGASQVGDFGVALAGLRGAARAGKLGVASVEDNGAAQAGDFGVAFAGQFGAASAGDCSVASVGDCGAAKAMDFGVANARDYGASQAGKHGVANVGDYGTAQVGDFGVAAVGSNGKASAGVGGVAVTLGVGGKAAGKVGAVLVLLERDCNYNIIHHRSILVDGVKYMADTYYTLEGGEVRKAD